MMSRQNGTEVSPAITCHSHITWEVQHGSGCWAAITREAFAAIACKRVDDAVGRHYTYPMIAAVGNVPAAIGMGG
jgi:hypothetical protein